MKNKNSICIVIQGRINSERCKRKMVRKIHDTSLIDQALSKINISKLSKNYNCYYAVGDKILIDKIKNYKNLKLIRRNKISINSDQPKIVYNYFNQIEEDYIVWINPCALFLKASTIENAIKIFFKNNKIKSMTSVSKKNTWLYNNKFQPIGNNNNLNSKLMKEFYLASQNFHIFNRKFYLEHAQYFNNVRNDPFLYEVEDIESLDVDTESEFELVKYLYWGIKKIGSIS